MAASGAGGLAAALVIAVSTGGVVCGASVGDCEAWVFGAGEPTNLTAGQSRKPLLGDGKAVPVGFSGHLARGRLVAASDGLWKYTSHARIANAAALHPIESAARALVDGARLRSGALQDDVAVLVCQVS
jgi:hypothetical protein